MYLCGRVEECGIGVKYKSPEHQITVLVAITMYASLEQR